LQLTALLAFILLRSLQQKGNAVKQRDVFLMFNKIALLLERVVLLKLAISHARMDLSVASPVVVFLMAKMDVNGKFIFAPTL
jgi:hypothetical protein